MRGTMRLFPGRDISDSGIKCRWILLSLGLETEFDSPWSPNLLWRAPRDHKCLPVASGRLPVAQTYGYGYLQGFRE